jgi:hypothetical protein
VPRDRWLRAISVAVLAALMAAFALVQLASDALEHGVAAPHTLARLVPVGFGLGVYHVLDRVAPAPYVEVMLAEQALRSGDVTAARRYAVKLPASPVRNELLGRIALRSGDRALAFEYFLAAPDPRSVQSEIDTVAARDPRRAYHLQRLLLERLTMLQTYPDLVADARWHMGELANLQAQRESAGGSARLEWERAALRDYRIAVALAPYSDKYSLAAANQAALLGDWGLARRFFARALTADPGSANALAGLGVVALARGDVRTAHAYLVRARAIDPHAGMVRALQRDLGEPR